MGNYPDAWSERGAQDADPSREYTAPYGSTEPPDDADALDDDLTMDARAETVSAWHDEIEYQAEQERRP